MAIDIRYSRVATAMLQKASRTNHPWQNRRSMGGPFIARGTVHIVLVGQGGPLLGVTDYCMTEPLFSKT